MYTPIYNSPFPSLNPRVRYKTALERAGFDVAYNGQQPDVLTGEGGRSRARSGKDGWLSKLGFKSGDTASVSGASAPAPVRSPISFEGRRHEDLHQQQQPKPAISHHSPQQGPKVLPFERGPTSTAAATHAASGSVQTREPSVFDFESNPYSRSGQPTQTHQSYPRQPDYELPARVSPPDSRSASELNPVEQSFLQLTQSTDSLRDSDSDSEARARHSDAFSRPLVENAPEHSPKRAHNSHISNSVENTPFANRESDASLSFTPVPELEVSFSPPRPTLAQDPSSDQSSRASPELLDSRQALSDSSVSAGESDYLGKSKGFLNTMNASHVAGYGEGPRHRKSASEMSDEEEEEEEDPVSTLKSSLQVERLLAQLNDVSLSRNLSIDKQTRLAGTSSNHIKKSSAYLSGFIPQNNSSIDAQTLVVDNSHISFERNNNLSPMSDGTPKFYHFKQVPHSPQTGEKSNVLAGLANSEDANNFEHSIRPSSKLLQPLQTPKLERTQLTRANTEEPLNSSEPAKSSNSHVSHSGDQLRDSSETTWNSQHSGPAPENPTQEIKFRHKPGEGPCRTCGKEIVTKRVFSKKDGELSGQWHRECFQCTCCDLHFSKKVACYILDDMPYCQSHFHQTNNSICTVCNGFIEGECLENDRSERFHIDCLKCFKCGVFIKEDYFLLNDELPICGQHDMEQIKQDYLSSDNLGRSNTIAKRRTRLINFL
ncbi:LAMI_0C03114g1_1 [Lachancea mirantina]|uniref:LAMI_0C03114g1_1 n=1 Tax=Lachancea mirantina TaxID=1230905 RepID=A0A1G4J1J8_9SACH|nr:LAMI_0C03114g1_1 [Lachancea mirantina]